MADITFHDLVKSVGSSASMGEERSARFVDALGAAIKSAVASGKSVMFPGFGSLGLPTSSSSGASANILGEVCSKLGESGEQRVKVLLDEVLGAAKKELLAGNRVALDGVGVFEVRSERPKVERQPKGHRLIKPAMSTLTFTSKDPIQVQGKPSQVVFKAADDLRRQVEAFKESSIMFVVPERDFFVKTLEYYFESAGWDVEVFTEMSEALKKIETGKAYLSILDGSFQDYQKFCYALKVRRETANVPLIVLYPSEESFKALPEVTVVGDDNLPQPFEFRQLLDLADGQIIRAAEEGLIFNQQLHIQLPTDEPSIEKVIDTVHKLLEGGGLNEEAQVALSAAFREAVVNAAQHGNKYKRERKIEVEYLLDDEKITAVVKDQGQGFNHSLYVKSGSTRDAISAARERHAQGRMGGLGIMLMLRCCDRLEYNQQGNQLTLTKFLKPQS